jgi:hypothetical protein
MLLEPITDKILPSFRSALRNEILRFATAHYRLQKPFSYTEPEDTERLKESAAYSAAKLKNEPFYLEAEIISDIAANPLPWIDEIYDNL